MGHREARRVPLGWEHPREPGTYRDGSPRFKPLHSRRRLLDLEKYAEPGDEPDPYGPDDYMPEFPEGMALGWCLYETTTEGTPVSPVFATAEKLAEWCADNATVFASYKWTREQWLKSFQDGSTDVNSLGIMDSSGLHVGDPLSAQG